MKRIPVGKILTPHGVKGQFKLKSFTEDPESIFTLSPVHTGDSALKGLKRMGVSGEVFIAALPDVTTREGAEALRNRELWVERSQLPELDEETYYIQDLMGLDVVDAATGKKLGLVKTIHNYGAGDMLEIDYGKGRYELLPFTKELLQEVDIAGRRITLNMPDYIEVKEQDE